MEENHVAFPWGATIIRGGEGLDGAKQGASKHRRRCRREDIGGPISGPR